MKKSEKIEIRVDEATKLAFAAYAAAQDKTISSILRDYIKECLNDGESN